MRWTQNTKLTTGNSSLIIFIPEPWTLENHMKLLKGEIGAHHDLFEGKALHLPEWFDQEKFQRYLLIVTIRYRPVVPKVVGPSPWG